MGKDSPQFRDIGGAETNAVETVGDVDFGKLGRPKPWIGVDEATQETWEGPAKLHGLGRRQPDCVVIDARVGVVNNQPRAALTLRHDAERGDAEVGDRESGGERKNRPETLLAELKDLAADKFHLVASRFVRPPVDGAAELLARPGGRPQGNGSSPAPQVIEKAACLVRKMADVGRNVGGDTERGDEGFPRAQASELLGGRTS